MAERAKPTEDELRAFSQHLLYEIEMMGETTRLLAVVDRMDASRQRTTLRNALLEAWALHVRNLLGFLYDTRAGKGDGIAPDFIGSTWGSLRGPKPDVLRVAHTKASKEIAHMSYVRSTISDEDREWHPTPIIAAIGKTMHAFLKAVPAALVIDGFHDRARQQLPASGISLSEHALQVVAGATQSLHEFRSVGDYGRS